MRLYVAGPMTGIPQFNFPAFDRAAYELRRHDFDVVSPAELDNDEDRAAAMASPDGSALDYGNGVKSTWGDFLSRDVKLITDGGIEAIVVLPGWERSRGARLETFVGAAMNGLPIYYYNGVWLPHMDRVPDHALVDAWAGSLDVYVAPLVEHVA